MVPSEFLPSIDAQLLTLFTTQSHCDSLLENDSDICLGRGEFITTCDVIPPALGGEGLVDSNYDVVLRIGDGVNTISQLPVIGGSKYVKMIEELYEAGGSGGASDVFWNTF